MAETFAVDVGGTFTDLVVLDGDTGAVRFAKAETTPASPDVGVLAAIAKADLSLPDARMFFHGTTLGINTVLEHKGARTGLITSRGFRDVLEIARMNWPMYRLYWDAPPPLVPRYLRREVRERVQADGTVLDELDEDEVRRTVRELVAEGIESIAVCFLHAYTFPEHERRVGEIIEEEFPGFPHTLSHLVTQEYREYERTVTTVSDATVKPILVGYIDNLDNSLRRQGFSGGLVMTRCDGGVMSATEAKERCIRTLISGPASGAMGAVALSRWLGVQNMIAVDMGGTSFDAALIVDQEPIVSALAHIEGLPLLVPVIELSTIGAGGGSIAWIDVGGALNVGPQSAGADPGPMCYGKGGTEPTFTDAALVSGLIDPDYFLGGEIRLDLAAARAGIEEKVAEPLHLELEEASSGIVALTEAKMAALLEEITVGKGYDPRDFTLLAYGGGGPLVASALAARLEIPRVVIPPYAATFSAWGMLTLDVVHDFSRTLISTLEFLDPATVTQTFAELDHEAHEALAREGIPPENRRLLRSVDMRYEGQEHTLNIALSDDFLTSPSLDALRRLFDDRHEVAYGYRMADPAEVTIYRIRAVGLLDKPRRPSVSADGTAVETARKGTRRAIHRESGGAFDWAVYDRERLPTGSRLEGPAIVEEPTATTIVAPGQTVEVDDIGNLILTRVA